MTLRTIVNDRLVDWNKLDNISVTTPINLDTINTDLSSIQEDISYLQDTKADLTLLDQKVDKVSWKWLSTEDYTTTEKNKLAGIEDLAQVNPTSTDELIEWVTNLYDKPVVLSTWTNITVSWTYPNFTISSEWVSDWVTITWTWTIADPFVSVWWGWDVVWPSSAVDSNFASFDTTTGKLIKDSWSKSSDFAPALWADDNYVTDAQLVVIGNTSWTNSWDNATNSQYSWLSTSKEDTSNKKTTMTWNESSGTFFLTAKAIYDWATWLFATIAQVLGRKKYHWIDQSTYVSQLPTNLTTTTFTLTCSTNHLTYWRNGVSTVVSTNKTATITNTVGIKYLYFTDDTGTITSYDTFQWLDWDKVILATVYWNGSNYWVINQETHWHTRDIAWHIWAHSSIFARYVSGLVFSFTWTTTANTTFSITSWQIDDEDIQFPISTQTQARTWQQTWATTYTFNNTLSTTPYLFNGTWPTAIRSDTYATVAISASNRYFNYWVFWTTSLAAPIHIFSETVAPANVWGYTSAANARLIAPPSLAWFWLSAEWKLLYRVVVNWAWLVQAFNATTDDFRTTSSVAWWWAISTITASAVTETVDWNVQTALDNIRTRIPWWNITDNVWYLNIPQNSKSAAYTTVLADSWKHIYHPSADTTARTFTIDSNTNVAYPIWTALTFVNDTSAWVMTIAITSDTLVLSWPWTTWSRTLAANWIATAIKVASTRWIISWTNLT